MSLTLRPIDPAALPDGLTPASDLVGIAVHWRAPVETMPETMPAPTRRRRSRKSTAPASDVMLVPATAVPWLVQRIAFHAVSASGESVPPRDADELLRYVRAAYVFTACHHPIPSDADVYYEVRW